MTMVQVIRTLCDPHRDETEHEGETFNIVISHLRGGQWVALDADTVIDLCDDQVMELLGDIRAVLDKYGRPDDLPKSAAPTKRAKKSDKRWYCRMPGCDKDYSTKQTLIQHYEGAHGYDTKSARVAAAGDWLEPEPIVPATEPPATPAPPVKPPRAPRRLTSIQRTAIQDVLASATVPMTVAEIADAISAPNGNNRSHVVNLLNSVGAKVRRKAGSKGSRRHGTTVWALTDQILAKHRPDEEGLELDMSTPRYPCTAAGCDVVRYSPQGLSAHMLSAHDVAGERSKKAA